MMSQHTESQHQQTKFNLYKNFSSHVQLWQQQFKE